MQENKDSISVFMKVNLPKYAYFNIGNLINCPFCNKILTNDFFEDRNRNSFNQRFCIGITHSINYYFTDSSLLSLTVTYGSNSYSWNFTDNEMYVLNGVDDRLQIPWIEPQLDNPKVFMKKIRTIVTFL